MKMNKKEVLKELEVLKKKLKGLDPDLDALQLMLSQDKLYHRTLTRYDSKGEMTIYYGNMTLTFYLKSGNIIIGDIVNIWDNSGTGFVGSFTERTLQMESSGELD